VIICKALLEILTQTIVIEINFILEYNQGGRRRKNLLTC